MTARAERLHIRNQRKESLNNYNKLKKLQEKNSHQLEILSKLIKEESAINRRVVAEVTASLRKSTILLHEMMTRVARIAIRVDRLEDERNDGQ